MIDTIFWAIPGLFLFGGIIMYMANRRTDAATRRQRRIKFGVYIIIIYAVIVSAFTGVFMWLIGLIILLGAYEMISIHRQNPSTRVHLLTLGVCGGIYLVLAYGLLSFARTASPETIVFAYLTVAVFDGFSQVLGQLLGKHPLAPTVSPGKTLEGTLGGICSAVLVAILLRELPSFSLPQAVLCGGLLSVAGLGGDLLASQYKRLHGVKDFGRILPGHGGVLDRFDSLFMAVTVFWLYTTYAT